MNKSQYALLWVSTIINTILTLLILYVTLGCNF